MVSSGDSGSGFKRPPVKCDAVTPTYGTALVGDVEKTLATTDKFYCCEAADGKGWTFVGAEGASEGDFVGAEGTSEGDFVGAEGTSEGDFVGAKGDINLTTGDADVTSKTVNADGKCIIYNTVTSNKTAPSSTVSNVPPKAAVVLWPSWPASRYPLHTHYTLSVPIMAFPLSVPPSPYPPPRIPLFP
jgi:hypothetical protein